MKEIGTFLLPFVLAASFFSTDGAKILGIFPLPSKSHMAVNAALMKELARRGHEVTVISPFPEEKPIANYTEINIGTSREDFFKHLGTNNSLKMLELGYVELILMFWNMGNSLSEQFLQQRELQDLIKSKDKTFDLIILEGFAMDCFLGFAHKFKTPLVQIISFGGTPWILDWVGNTSPYSYIPDTFRELSSRMNFWERLVNTLGLTFQQITRNILFLPAQQKIMEKYFGEYGPLPSVSELEASTSLLLLNHHFSISYSRPLTPNTIEVGGMHIKPPKKLPQDLQKYLDDSSEGVIYFSLGSAFYSSDLPEHIRQVFLDVFSKIKHKVLWKWETDSLPGQPSNVKLGKWLPQSDILAHPNVKLFISHGGLLSTQETIYRGVPVVGIPLGADQKLNIARAVKAGYAIKVDFSSITRESLTWALKEALENPIYKENAKRLSRIYQDQPLTPLDTAVYWTEYVIRHKGAPHMRSAALDLSWYQYFLLDVIAVLVLGTGSVLLIAFLILRFLFRKCFVHSKQESKVSSKKKKN